MSDEQKKKQMGQVIPLFGNRNPLEIPRASDEELEDLYDKVMGQLHSEESEPMTLYEWTELHMEKAETYMTKNGQVVVVPIDDMDGLVEEIIDASAKLSAYEHTLQEIEKRGTEYSSKLAREVLTKYNGTL